MVADLDTSTMTLAPSSLIRFQAKSGDIPIVVILDSEGTGDNEAFSANEGLSHGRRRRAFTAATIVSEDSSRENELH